MKNFLHQRDSFRPAAALRLLVVPALIVVVACTGLSTGTTPMTLRFAAGVEEAGFRAPRALARSVAATYVKVTVLRQRDAAAEPGATAAGGIVTGASGILVDPGGTVMTAAHIARGTGFHARVTTLDGREYPARIVRVDRESEMALLKIRSARRFAAAEAGNGVETGQPVLAIGTPDNKPGVVAVGRVAIPRIEGRIGYGEFGHDNPIRLQIDAGPGFSGGPVFDEQGRLQGMVIGFDLRRDTSGELVNTGFAYAVPAATLMDAARDWSAAAGE